MVLYNFERKTVKTNIYSDIWETNSNLPQTVKDIRMLVQICLTNINLIILCLCITAISFVTKIETHVIE